LVFGDESRLVESVGFRARSGGNGLVHWYRIRLHPTLLNVWVEPRHMKVLVDYDNIPGSIARQGLTYLADRILMKVHTIVPTLTALDLRLYGGWDRKNQLTKTGQELATQLRSHFPRVLTVTAKPIRLNMQLAESLEALPGKRFVNTLRTEPVRKIKSFVPSHTTCRNSSCPIDVVAVFLNAARCPAEGCMATPQMLLSQDQQKMVDTMMVADLIHLASADGEPLAIVTSDDDLWPGILSALARGTSVIHLQTRTVNNVPPYLTRTPGIYTTLGL
jgi:hypothetical protein